MIQLAAAITSRFPQGNEWATLALDGLADGVGPTTLVHGIAEGWYRRGDGPDAVLVDTLFVLTDDRLGLGQVGASPAGVPSGAPRWIELSQVTAVDAVDNSILPLQTIEMELANGAAICVGWPETFSDSLVAALLAVAGRAAVDADHRLPAELMDAPVADDASALDDLAPSAWVEQEVTAPTPPARPLTAAIGFLNRADLDPAVDASADEPTSDLDTEPEAEAVPSVDALVAPEIEPIAEPEVEAIAEPEIEAVLDTAPHDVLGELADLAPSTPPGADAWFAVDATIDPAPIDPRSFAVDAAADAPADAAHDDAADMAHDDAADVPVDSEPAVRAPVGDEEPPPWRAPGMTWPDPLRGVLYLGGHPGYTRKRKNGTMVFSPQGLDVAGSGFQDWNMSIDWAFLDGVEVQGPDEIMFGDNIKIDPTSSALVVSMVDGTRMFFEVRTRRPPSLRSTLAPVLLLADSARSWRAQHPAS